ncbi:MAG: O-antigen ligase family protein [Candidatus Acidiferrales bacterium]
MSSSSSESQTIGVRRVLAQGATAAETSTGLAVIAIGGATALLYEFAMSVGKWVPFFLSYKPLIDLTWRWEFIRIVHQSVNIQSILAMFVVVLNGIVVLFSRQRPRHSGLVLMLLGTATVSVIVTPTSWGLNELLRLYAGMSFFFTAGLVLCDKRRFDRFVHCFLWALMVPVILAIFQAIGIVPYEYWDWTDMGLVGRASGSYQHPLDLAFFLVYAIPLALYRMEDPDEKVRNRAFLVTFLGLAVLALVFTILRMGWFAVCVQIGLWFMFKKKYKLIAASGVVLLLLLLAFSGWVETIFEPQNFAHEDQSLISPTALRGRGANYILFVNSYLDAGPLHWLIGRGGSVAEGYIQGIGEYSSNEPHDDFIRLLHAYGLLGLGLYFVILWKCFRDSRALQKSRDHFSREVGNIFIVALAAILLLSITAEPMRFPTGVWYLFALGSVASMLRHRVGVHGAPRTV